MKTIKDILNRDLVNLVNCESEPIHVPGSIQPHGFLLAVNAQNNLIDFCSANCQTYTGMVPQLILGKFLSDIFSIEQTNDFEQYIHDNTFDYAKPFIFTLNQTQYNTTVHESKNHYLLEFEPFPDGSLNLPDLYNQTRKFVSFMEGTSKLIELCQAIATETRVITGYDRVLIYRFDKLYNGEVIAESKRDDLISFAGQKYPHTDIPAQARELYIRNPIRMIADIDYVPVPLLTLDDKEEKNNESLDLSLSMLRSVSPIHIEYLKNMGVGATLTVSLLKDQRLWGLIACHHDSPKILPHYTRLAALLQGHFLTSQIEVREVGEEFVVAQEVENALQKALLLLHESQKIVERLYTSPFLLRLANATGVVIFYEEVMYASGLVPADQDLAKLHAWLTANYKSPFSTSSLIEIYPEAAQFSKFGAGIIYYALSDTDCIIWLRAEVIQTINWAGNPNKAVEINQESGNLTPRKSFELWMEIVKNKSEEWRKSELNASSSFAHALQKHINLHYVKRQEEKYRALNAELKAANKELANLNWISTHDLKEPLRKIQVFASKVLASNITEQVKDSVNRMRNAAEKMQRLIDDILSYSKAGNMEKIFVETDLNQILQNVLIEIQEEIREKNALITYDQLPVMLAIPFQISQLFVNVIGNALKFTDPDRMPKININLARIYGYNFPGTTLAADRSYYKIAISDNGIGFEEIYNERIFDVFQRLHPTSRYPGSGIGLAICKKITENHKGTILTQSVPGEGSVFSIFLPIT